MKFFSKYLLIIFLSLAFSFTHFISFAQKDTTKEGKTFMGKVIENFKKDSTEIDYSAQFKTTEAAFKPYEGLIIRNIIIERIPFGVSIGDTSIRLINSLTKLANDLHHITKTKVVRKNLFF